MIHSFLHDFHIKSNSVKARMSLILVGKSNQRIPSTSIVEARYPYNLPGYGITT